jgi:aminoglycoside phosphotransferase (APT) family kinase protein
MGQLGLDASHDLQLVSWSQGRAVFAINNESAYFIKVYSDPLTLHEEARNLAIAAVAGIPVPRSLDLRDDGGVAVLVLTALPGRRISPADRAAWHDLGTIVKRISGIDPPPGSWVPRWPEVIINRTRQELAQWVSLDLVGANQASVLVAAIQDLEPVLASRQLTFTHNDLQVDHVLIDPETNRVSGLVDWADARIADPLLDLAIVSMDVETPLADLLAGFGDAGSGTEELIPWYRLLKRLGAATWLRRQGRIGLAQIEEVEGIKLLSRVFGIEPNR